ncbi:MAG: hypothetical protein GWN64_12635, partial [Candidatus Thorarchaeota archaeon]|nr:hypothetical protein [Candidatus Thorarchaeota archaeon]
MKKLLFTYVLFTTAISAVWFYQTFIFEPELIHEAETEAIDMRVTAYCPCSKCCGKYADGITASGHKIQPGDAFV